MCKSCLDSTSSQTSLSSFRYSNSRRQIKLQRSHTHKVLLLLTLPCSPLFFVYSIYHSVLSQFQLIWLKIICCYSNNGTSLYCWNLAITALPLKRSQYRRHLKQTVLELLMKYREINKCICASAHQCSLKGFCSAGIHVLLTFLQKWKSLQILVQNVQNSPDSILCFWTCTAITAYYMQ